MELMSYSQIYFKDINMLCLSYVSQISPIFLLCPPHPSLSLYIISYHFYERPSIKAGHLTLPPTIFSSR